MTTKEPIIQDGVEVGYRIYKNGGIFGTRVFSGYEWKDNVLKPCPFCGSGSATGVHLSLGMKRITCPNCGVSTKDFKTEVEAVISWNTRHI